ncbi:MAG: hypothetical protein JO225_03460 [Candidatus Eremiobacteraeota bacterium]|nr:hypothetical protein [Candidatus Eremiobacteraeota bacterium]
MVQDRAELNDALAAQAFRTFSIQMTNSSGTVLVLQNFFLTGGSWVTPPQAGSSVNPGDTKQYDNFTDAAFTGLGGQMVFIPTTGGTITVNWNWPWGGLATGSATAANLSGISVSSTVINQNTSNPILQVTILNAPST